MQWLAIACGGALGSLARWGIALVLAGSVVPLSTVLVNMVGAYALGWMVGRFTAAARSSPLLLGVTSGFLGAFTTMSAFGLETWTLWLDGQWLLGMGYMAVSAAVGPWLAGAGLRSGRRAAVSE